MNTDKMLPQHDLDAQKLGRFTITEAGRNAIRLVELELEVQRLNTELEAAASVVCGSDERAGRRMHLWPVEPKRRAMHERATLIRQCDKPRCPHCGANAITPQGQSDWIRKIDHDLAVTIRTPVVGLAK